MMKNTADGTRTYFSTVGQFSCGAGWDRTPNVPAVFSLGG